MRKLCKVLSIYQEKGFAPKIDPKRAPPVAVVNTPPGISSPACIFPAAPLTGSKQPDLHLTSPLPSAFHHSFPFQTQDTINYPQLVPIPNQQTRGDRRDLTVKMSEEPRTSSIDETPIAPVREPSHVRQNSLEKHLQHRPDPKELRERHILLDNNAAPYVPIPSIGARRRDGDMQDVG